MTELMPSAPGRSRLNSAANRYIYAKLDADAMRWAFADLVRRHEPLRLVFDAYGIEPKLHIEPAVDPPVDYLDLSGLDPTAQQDAIAELAYRENLRPFDLQAGPCWHAWCIRTSRDRFFLNASMCEIIADGWSTKVFVDDLLHSYAVGMGTGAPADPPPTYEQIRAIQLQRLEPRDDRLAYWRGHLALRPGQASERPRVSLETSVLAPSRIDIALSPGLRKTLGRLAWHYRTTPYVVMMAAYHAFLTLTTEQARTVVSTVSMSRVTDEERRSMWPCTIDPYVSISLSARTSLGEAVQLTHVSLDRAVANLMSFTNVARAVNPLFDAERPWSDSHLCDGNFYSSAFGDEQATLSGMYVVGLPLAGHAPVDRTDSTLRIGDMLPKQRDAWIDFCGPTMEVSHLRDVVSLMYNGEMYTHEDMHKQMDTYLWVLRQMAMSPGLTMGTLANRHTRLSAVDS